MRKWSIFDIDTEDEYIKNKDEIDINEITDTMSENALFGSSLNKKQWLIKHGINVNQQDKYGDTALFRCDEDEAELLIKAGINVNAKNNDGRNALYYSDSEKKTRILMDNNLNIHEIDDFGFNALMFVDKDSCHLLIENNINIHLLNPSKGNAFFFVRDEKCFAVLKEKGLDINHLNSVDQNALFNKDINKTKELIKLGCSINHRDKWGYNALVYADEETSEYLIEQGIDIDIFTPEILDKIQKEMPDYISADKRLMIEEARANKEKEIIITCLSKENVHPEVRKSKRI